MEVVFCFDRDGTIDTSYGPVPLAWVRQLAREYPVYAIGNQMLVQEAGVPGVEHLRSRVGDHDQSNATHVVQIARLARLRMVEQLHPDADLFIHVDDVDVQIADGRRWHYYTPDAFVQAARNGELPVDLAL